MLTKNSTMRGRKENAKKGSEKPSKIARSTNKSYSKTPKLTKYITILPEKRYNHNTSIKKPVEADWLGGSNFSFHENTADIGIQTDRDTIVESLRDYVSVLKQRVKILERELKKQSDIIISLSNGNAYLQQQSISQLSLIRRLTPDRSNENSSSKPEGYTKLKNALRDAENTIMSKERLIRSLRSPRQSTQRNRSESKTLRSETNRYRKRNQESSVGELLRWSTPDKPCSIPSITSKVTERPFELAREVVSAMRSVGGVEEELGREVEERERLEERHRALKDLTSAAAVNKKKALERDIKMKDEKIKNMENEIKSFKAYYAI